jgi:hypothetical protein
MWSSILRAIALLSLLTMAWSDGVSTQARGAGPTLLVTMDYSGGGLAFNPANHPYLQIYSNGSVVVTNAVTGAKTQARLTARQLNNLLAFINVQNQFPTLSTAQISNAIAAQNPMFVIGDGTTTTITLSTRNGPHSVSVYAADTYLGAFPNIIPLAEFVTIEQRLQQIANTAR